MRELSECYIFSENLHFYARNSTDLTLFKAFCYWFSAFSRVRDLSEFDAPLQNPFVRDLSEGVSKKKVV